MNSYWAAVGVILAIVGAAFKYMVWDFFFKVQTLDEQYSTRIVETHAAMRERKFVPIIAKICEDVAARKIILPTVSTVELLTEVSIDAMVREAIVVISERIALDRAYRWARRLSIWVAVIWIVCFGFFIVLFFRHFDAHVGIKSLWIPTLLAPVVLSGGLGCCTLTLYRLALNRFIRSLSANPL